VKGLDLETGFEIGNVVFLESLCCIFLLKLICSIQAISGDLHLKKMNLDFDDSKRMHYGVTKQERVKMLQRFIKRVDGKLALCKNVPLNRFSIKCKDDVGPAPVIGWITNVLKRRVSELALDISSCWDWPMSTAIDGCNTMVQEFWESCSVSSTSLKRLTFRFNQMFFENHKSVSFVLLISCTWNILMSLLTGILKRILIRLLKLVLIFK